MTDKTQQAVEALKWAEKRMKSLENRYGHIPNVKVKELAALKTLTEALRSSQWRDISEYDYIKLPVVLVWRNGKTPIGAVAYLSDCGYGWRQIGGDKHIEKPTHWQPLPSPPAEKE